MVITELCFIMFIKGALKGTYLALDGLDGPLDLSVGFRVTHGAYLDSQVKVDRVLYRLF